MAAVVGRIIDEELLVFLVLGVKRQAQQPFFVAPVDRVGKLEEEFLVAGCPLVGERPDRGGVLLDHEEQVAAVVGISKRDRPVEPEVREGDLGRKRRQRLGRFLLLRAFLVWACDGDVATKTAEGHQRGKNVGNETAGNAFESMSVGILSIPSIGSE